MSPAAQPFAITPGFWTGKRVFLTGHTGFKGSWLLHWLDMLGAVCRGFALKPDTVPAMFELTEAARLCDHVEGDVRDAAALRAALQAFRPDIVIHLAAQSLVRRSYHEPVATMATNVMGTVNILEACRACDSVGAVVIVTTDKCYVNRVGAVGCRESDPLGGTDPYGASKACAEIVTEAWRSSFLYFDGPISRTLPTSSARAGNVIGGGDYAKDRLLPDAARAFARGEPVVIRHPGAVRPWQHCVDPLAGYLQLARACFEAGTTHARAYNFGPAPEQFLAVGDLITRFCAAWGGGAQWRQEAGEAHLKETDLLLLDADLARRSLGWQPLLDFDAALAATVTWYQTASNGGSPASLSDLTRAQITALSGGDRCAGGSGRKGASMQFRPTSLKDAMLILTEPVSDERGWFMRTFCDRELANAGLETVFHQGNLSHNHRSGTLRGMHFQRPPHAEVKIVRCLRGATHHVIIDLRPNSPSFLRWEGFTLSGESFVQLYVPRGFAHGYLTLADNCTVSYATSHPYVPQAEGGVRWDDPCFGIDWPEAMRVISDKDRAWPDFDPGTGGLEC